MRTKKVTFDAWLWAIAKKCEKLWLWFSQEFAVVSLLFDAKIFFWLFVLQIYTICGVKMWKPSPRDMLINLTKTKREKHKKIAKSTFLVRCARIYHYWPKKETSRHENSNILKHSHDSLTLLTLSLSHSERKSRFDERAQQQNPNYEYFTKKHQYDVSALLLLSFLLFLAAVAALGLCFDAFVWQAKTVNDVVAERQTTWKNNAHTVFNIIKYLLTDSEFPSKTINEHIPRPSTVDRIYIYLNL